MDRSTKQLFKQIFYEAHIVDFDLSQWDRRLQLLVVAIGLEEAQRRQAVYAIEFRGFSEFRWISTHLDVKLDGPERHCQWVVMDYRHEQDKDFEKITIVGPGSPCPDFTIWCREVVITEFDGKVIDAVNPSWNRPFAPLARPGITELHASLRLGKPPAAGKKLGKPKRSLRGHTPRKGGSA